MLVEWPEMACDLFIIWEEYNLMSNEAPLLLILLVLSRTEYVKNFELEKIALNITKKFFSSLSFIICFNIFT